jgi:hypothetical protein
MKPRESPDFRESLKKLDRVVRFLENMNEAPQWYESETLKIGSWIQFDTRLSYSAEGLAFFMWTPGLRDRRLGESFLPDIMLLLHGSSEHALEYRRSVGQAGDSLGGGDRRGASTAHGFFKIMQVELSRLDPSTSGIDRSRSAGEDLKRMLHYLCVDYPQDGQGNMIGYARVTSVEDLGPGPEGQETVLVLASPLYVEEV